MRDKESMKLSSSIMMVVVFAVVLSLTVVEGYTTVTFELSNGVTGYSSFLTMLRNEVAASTACGLQSTRKTPLRGAEYVYVDLKISNTQLVTLGVDVTNLYVWGYQDKGSKKANILKDAPDSVKKNLFPGSTIRITRFRGNYKDLEDAAGTTRMNLGLGIESLYTAIKGVYGKTESELNKGTAEGKFFLVAIQMVAEAARFKFMENAIVESYITPDFKLKMVAFQNDWKPISNAIHKAEAEIPKCTKITPTLVISRIGYRLEVNTVAEIKNEMGLLLYKSPTLVISRIWYSRIESLNLYI